MDCLESVDSKNKKFDSLRMIRCAISKNNPIKKIKI